MTKRPLLSAFQLFSLCAITSMLGLSVSFPGRMTTAYFWIAIAAFAIQAVSAALLSWTFERTKCDGFGELTSQLLSEPISHIVLAIIGLILALRASLTLSIQVNTVNMYLLEDTSEFAVMLILIVTAFYALMPGIGRMSGVATLLTLILPLILIIIIATGLWGIDWGELRTLYQIPSGEFSGAIAPAILTASGAECALFFLGSKRSSSGAGKGAAAAPAFSALLMTAMTLVTIGTIGIDGYYSEPYPFIEASRQISSGGIELTERFDLPLITVSLLASIVQLAVYTLCASLSLAQSVGSGSTGAFALGLLPVEFGMAMLLQYTGFGNAAEAVCAFGILGCVTALFPLLAFLSLIKKRGGRLTNE